MRRKILFNSLNELTSRNRELIKIFPNSRNWCISFYDNAFSINWLKTKRAISVRKGRGLARVSFRFGDITLFGYNIIWVL